MLHAATTFTLAVACSIEPAMYPVLAMNSLLYFYFDSEKYSITEPLYIHHVLSSVCLLAGLSGAVPANFITNGIIYAELSNFALLGAGLMIESTWHKTMTAAAVKYKLDESKAVEAGIKRSVAYMYVYDTETRRRYDRFATITSLVLIGETMIYGYFRVIAPLYFMYHGVWFPHSRNVPYAIRVLATILYCGGVYWSSLLVRSTIRRAC